MNDNEMETLIDKKIADAKLEIADKRMNLVLAIGGGILAVFGVFVPIMLTIQSSNRVDTAVQQMRDDINNLGRNQQMQTSASTEKAEKATQEVRDQFRELSQNQARESGSAAARVEKAIQEMRSQFKELAGTQLRKPVLDCTVEGKALDGNLLTFSTKKNEYTFEVRNSGDAPARNIRLRLYLKIDKPFPLFMGEWSELSYSDEPSYTRVFEISRLATIDPKDAGTVTIQFLTEEKRQIHSPALLKVFYEQPEPKKYTFSVLVTQD